MSRACNGCRHYQPVYETCGALAGQLRCEPCNHTWQIAQGGGCCPKCSGFKGLVDLSECPAAVPSMACPGREDPDVVAVQGELF